MRVPGSANCRLPRSVLPNSPTAPRALPIWPPSCWVRVDLFMTLVEATAPSRSVLIYLRRVGIDLSGIRPRMTSRTNMLKSGGSSGDRPIEATARFATDDRSGRGDNGRPHVAGIAVVVHRRESARPCDRPHGESQPEHGNRDASCYLDSAIASPGAARRRGSLERSPRPELGIKDSLTVTGGWLQPQGIIEQAPSLPSGSARSRRQNGREACQPRPTKGLSRKLLRKTRLPKQLSFAFSAMALGSREGIVRIG